MCDIVRITGSRSMAMFNDCECCDWFKAMLPFLTEQEREFIATRYIYRASKETTMKLYGLNEKDYDRVRKSIKFKSFNRDSVVGLWGTDFHTLSYGKGNEVAHMMGKFVPEEYKFLLTYVNDKNLYIGDPNCISLFLYKLMIMDGEEFRILRKSAGFGGSYKVSIAKQAEKLGVSEKELIDRIKSATKEVAQEYWYLLNAVPLDGRCGEYITDKKEANRELERYRYLFEKGNLPHIEVLRR